MAKKGLARALGEFWGHISKAVKTPVEADGTIVRKQTVRTTVEERRVETEAGPLTLRRTTIDEVERRGS